MIFKTKTMTCEFFKKLKLDLARWLVQFQLLEKHTCKLIIVIFILRIEEILYLQPKGVDYASKETVSF